MKFNSEGNDKWLINMNNGQTSPVLKKFKIKQPDNIFF